MNNRIQELIEQATVIKEVDCEGYLGRAYTRQEKYFDKEKFAKLIVEECIKESMEEMVDEEEIVDEENPLIREYLMGNNQGITDAVVRFRNYFGVNNDA
jgi:hypothetical protein